MGGDSNILGVQLRVDVSIHAPVWGATIEELTKKIKELVSIHAPVWGATRDRSHPTP